jgi:hypothetical protein
MKTTIMQLLNQVNMNHIHTQIVCQTIKLKRSEYYRCPCVHAAAFKNCCLRSVKGSPISVNGRGERTTRVVACAGGDRPAVWPCGIECRDSRRGLCEAGREKGCSGHHRIGGELMWPCLECGRMDRKLGEKSKATVLAGKLEVMNAESQARHKYKRYDEAFRRNPWNCGFRVANPLWTLKRNSTMEN